MPQHHVVIIGSGIAGASTAFSLARRGVAVTLVESSENGQATAASAGIISPWASAVDGPFYDLYSAGAAHYPVVLQLLADVGVTHTDYRKTGALLVNTDPDALRVVEERTRDRAKDAPEIVGKIERLDNAQLRELFPPLAEELLGVLIEGGGRVDGRTMRDALLLGAAHYGAVTKHGSASVTREASGRAAVFVAGERIGADAVVVAAGAWSRTLLESVGVDVAMNPQRGQITHLRVDGVDTTQWPSVHPLSSHYMVAFDDSRVAIGATRETGSGFDVRITAGGQKQVLEDALSIAPGLTNATFIETRVGLRPLPDGQLPFIGSVTELDGLYVNTGFGAAGLTMGPVVGELLAKQILAEESSFDLTPFRPDRGALA